MGGPKHVRGGPKCVRTRYLQGLHSWVKSVKCIGVHGLKFQGGYKISEISVTTYRINFTKYGFQNFWGGGHKSRPPGGTPPDPPLHIYEWHWSEPRLHNINTPIDCSKVLILYTFGKRSVIDLVMADANYSTWRERLDSALLQWPDGHDSWMYTLRRCAHCTHAAPH